jgi:hypothetical protein
MTKAKSKPCICCVEWNGACSKGHKPRFYKDGGLRRVCDDFSYPAPIPMGTKDGLSLLASAIMKAKRLFGCAS